MRKAGTWLAGALAGAAALAGGRVWASFEEGKPAAGCTVAFVSIPRVFVAYPKAKKVLDDLNAEAEKRKGEFQDREQALKKDLQDLEARLTPGTAEFEEGRKRVEMKIAELQFDKKAATDLFVRRQVVSMAGVYREVCAEAERIAGEKGFACVLNFDPEPIQVEDRGQVMGQYEFKLQMALRTVLWARPDADLTGEVIEALARGLEKGK